jgi:hypothetical protein
MLTANCAQSTKGGARVFLCSQKGLDEATEGQDQVC